MQQEAFMWGQDVQSGGARAMAHERSARDRQGRRRNFGVGNAEQYRVGGCHRGAGLRVAAKRASDLELAGL
jgi:hypothetical protein